VFKQGDDLAYKIKVNNGNLAEAFRDQADAYQDASEICRKLAGVCAETPGMDVIADCHMVQIDGPPETLAVLAKDGFVEIEEFDDDWDEDSEDGLDPDDDGLDV